MFCMRVCWLVKMFKIIKLYQKLIITFLCSYKFNDEKKINNENLVKFNFCLLLVFEFYC